VKEPIDVEWVKEQLTENKTKKVVGDSVIKLINAWNSLTDTTEANKKEIVAVFSKLSLSEAIVKDNPNEIWVDARPGDLKVADVVRVKANAFEGKSGQMHNGRKGRIVAVRYGDIIVKSNDNRQPILEGAHYSPHMLEKLIIK
jgi:hypothetical protein